MQRITNSQSARQFVYNLNSTQSRMFDLQRQISTGLRINAPHDDPYGVTQAMGFDAQLRDVEQFQRNVGDAISYTNTAESALGGVTSTLQRVRELVLQASNSSNDQNALNSIAQEISQLKQVLRDQGNTRYGDNYIFSGTAIATQPYPSAAGNPYDGNDKLINRRVSPGLEMSINTTGPQVFGTTTGPASTQMDMFDLMDQIVANLSSGLPANRELLRTDDLEAIDAHLDNVLQQRAKLGAQVNRLEINQERLADHALRVREARSNLMDTDIAETYMKYQTEQTMYESALAIGSRLMGTSLVDFLR